MRTQAELALLAAFTSHRDRLAGAQGERADAFKMFEEAGLPHRRVEEWKYTDLRALMREAKPLAAKADAAALAAAKDAARSVGVEARRLVLVNGVFEPLLSDMADLEAGLSIVSLGHALVASDDALAGLGKTVPTNDIVVALNTAFMTDGVVIRVAKDARIARPIHIVNVFAGREAAAVFSRSLVVVEEAASLSLIESHEGPAGIDYQANIALELVVGDRAQVERVKIGREGDKALHLSTVMAAVGADALLRDFTLTVGGAVTRNQLFIRLGGERTHLAVSGANLLRGRQHVDTTMVVDHAAGGCEGREKFKSVLDDQARAVFQGKIIVRQGAQKTDAKMATNALLLSDEAESDNKPELEIFADDVQCGHGATAGALDEDLLFYLKARGISHSEAEALLIQSFVGEAIETVQHEGLREALIAIAAQWLKARG
jgi:Fe-S cluster assembly protein SufD